MVQRRASYTFAAGRFDFEESVMKVLTATLVLGAMLGGCATSPAPGQAQVEGGLDSARMSAIEREALRAGVRVYWINAPRKAVKANG